MLASVELAQFVGQTRLYDRAKCTKSGLNCRQLGLLNEASPDRVQNRAYHASLQRRALSRLNRHSRAIYLTLASFQRQSKRRWFVGLSQLGDNLVESVVVVAWRALTTGTARAMGGEERIEQNRTNGNNGINKHTLCDDPTKRRIVGAVELSGTFGDQTMLIFYISIHPFISFAPPVCLSILLFIQTGRPRQRWFRADRPD